MISSAFIGRMPAILFRVAEHCHIVPVNLTVFFTSNSCSDGLLTAFHLLLSTQAAAAGLVRPFRRFCCSLSEIPFSTVCSHSSISSVRPHAICDWIAPTPIARIFRMMNDLVAIRINAFSDVPAPLLAVMLTAGIVPRICRSTLTGVPLFVSGTVP